MTITLTDEERHTVWHALNVSTEQFKKDAAHCRQDCKPPLNRIAEQFEKQAKDTEALIERFE